MPPRRPPPPPVLTILCTVAALAAAWLTVAVDQASRGLVGAAAGVPWHGLAIDPARGWSAVAVQGPVGSPGVGALALMLLAGGVVVPVLAIGLSLVTDILRSSGWVRALALAWLVIACLWMPTVLAAAALPGGAGGGPGAELYARLGEPETGRWASLALATLLLVLVSGPLARRAVGVGRGWMRADAPGFRRRLVRVVAGWPAAVALCGVLFGTGWARTPWALLWAAVVAGALHFRTR